MITNVPKEIIDENILWINFVSKNFFKKEDISAINICYVFENLKKLVKKKTILNKKYHNFLDIKDRDYERKKWYQIFRYKDISSKIKDVTEKMNEIDKLIDEEKKKELVATGCAFITFKTKEAAKKCLKFSWNNWKFLEVENSNEKSKKIEEIENTKTEAEFIEIDIKGSEPTSEVIETSSEQPIDSIIVEENDNPQEKRQFLKKLKFKYAPQPSSIIWENLKYPIINRYFREISGIVFLVIVFILVASINLAFQTLSKLRSVFSIPLSNFYLQSNQTIQLVIKTISLLIDGSLVVTIASILFTFLIIKIHSKFVKKYSIVEEMKLNARGVLFFLFLNAFIVPKLPLLFFGFRIAFSSNATFNTYDYLVQTLTPPVLQVVVLVPMLVGSKLSNHFNFNFFSSINSICAYLTYDHSIFDKKNCQKIRISIYNANRNYNL